jgi:hypothetical protein
MLLLLFDTVIPLRECCELAINPSNAQKMLKWRSTLDPTLARIAGSSENMSDPIVPVRVPFTNGQIALESGILFRVVEQSTSSLRRSFYRLAELGVSL